MSRSPSFARIGRVLRIVRFCNERGLSTADGLDLVCEAEGLRSACGQTRREWLSSVARAGAAAVVASPLQGILSASPNGPSVDVGIVGAGLAGLACADALAARGVAATVYEASERSGGRCWSLRGVFPGQVAERGGELIDNVAVRRVASGAIELTFDTSGGPVVRTHDVVVLAIPFTVLRDVDLHPSLNLSSAKRSAMDLLGYGTNAKMMVGFDARPWLTHGSSGASYSDLANHQATWERNPSRGTVSRGVLTDYSGGDRGAGLDPSAVQLEASAFLSDLDLVYPGAAAAASHQNGGDLVAHLEHWPSNPFARGSYTCYLPGQFTTIAGLEGLPAGNLHFAGEHANSSYEWQGFMEGAALSGLDAAAGILHAAKAK